VRAVGCLARIRAAARGVEKCLATIQRAISVVVERSASIAPFRHVCAWPTRRAQRELDDLILERAVVLRESNAAEVQI